jgi:hypothetical protein
MSPSGIDQMPRYVIVSRLSLSEHPHPAAFSANFASGMSAHWPVKMVIVRIKLISK